MLQASGRVYVASRRSPLSEAKTLAQLERRTLSQLQYAGDDVNMRIGNIYIIVKRAERVIVGYEQHLSQRVHRTRNIGSNKF